MARAEELPGGEKLVPALLCAPPGGLWPAFSEPGEQGLCLGKEAPETKVSPCRVYVNP